MKVKAEDKSTTNGFVELRQSIDSLFDNFTVRLYDLCSPVNGLDKYMCYLIKEGISPMGIVSLQDRTPSAYLLQYTIA